MELERSWVRGYMQILGTIFLENGDERSIALWGTRAPRRLGSNFVTGELRARELSMVDRLIQRLKAALSPRLFCVWSHGSTPPVGMPTYTRRLMRSR
jgi:hypothetical protein